jgi:hypothetical protein
VISLKGDFLDLLAHFPITDKCNFHGANLGQNLV